jgi:hypothetical protein
MLEITIAHAVTKPMVRVGGTDLTAAGWVSVVIRQEFYSTLLLQNAEHPKFNAKDRTKDGGPFKLVFIVACFARGLSSVVRSASKHQFGAA